MDETLLESTFESASYNIIYQVILRFVTFLCNGILLRYASQAVLGVINVRLLLLESTVLFLSREGFRQAFFQHGSHSWKQVINLLWLTVPLSGVLSALFGFIWLNVINVPSVDITSHYAIGVWSISVGCVIEMFSEPLYLIAQGFRFHKLQVKIRSGALLIRTLIFVPWTVYRPAQAVLAFSAAQIVANIIYSLLYYGYFYTIVKKNRSEGNLNNVFNLKDFPFKSLKDFLPSFKVEKNHWVHPDSARLTWSFFQQGLVKQVLTEGERYVMTFMMTFTQQGVYDVINNLGSLPARFLFRPIEDAFSQYFRQTVIRDVDVKKQDQELMKKVATVLHQVLQCITSLGLVIVVFGQSYSRLLLFLYGGEGLSSGLGSDLLRAYCFYVVLLGINGITECFSSSTMTADELNKNNYWMTGFSVMYLFLTWALTSLFGEIGFIYANCCNMFARIIYSSIFIKNRYKKTSFKPLNGLKPDKSFLVGLSIALLITKSTEVWFSIWIHILVGGISFVIVSAIWCNQKRDLVQSMYQSVIQKWKNKNKHDL